MLTTYAASSGTAPFQPAHPAVPSKSMEWLHLLSPNLTDWLLSRLGYRPQFTDQPKSDQAPSNLYEHIEGYDQVQGSFGGEARAISLYTGLEMNPRLRWGLLGVLAGMGLFLMRRRKS